MCPTGTFKNADSKGNVTNKEEGRTCLFLKRLGQEGFVDIRSRMTHEKRQLSSRKTSFQ